MSAANASAACEPTICEPGGKGLFLPALGGHGEQEWPAALRALLYLAGLLWLFMAVAVVSDIFMGAIERITSKKKRVYNQTDGRIVTVKVWNDTVANLTLMALGSSAPEILLSVIELTLLPPVMMAGDLGPSTIVGSAAFNLHIITAVCMCSIPGGEVRYIKDTGVFAITAFFSVAAYVWLLVIVQFNSPNIIEIWEGAVTLLGFPFLVGASYLADIGYFSDKVKMISSRKPDVPSLTKDDLAAMSTRILLQHGGNLTDHQLVKLIERESQANHSRAHYRVASTRNLVGGRRVNAFGDQQNQQRTQQLSSVVPVDYSTDAPQKKRSSLSSKGSMSTVWLGFTSSNYAVLESVGTIVITVDRSGDVSKCASVEYATRDGTAVANADYIPVADCLYFAPGEVQKSISITIIDDTAYEDDEEFFVDLTSPSSDDAEFGCVALNNNSTARICIVDDDEPGTICFECDSNKNADELRVTEAEGGIKKTYTVTVKRYNGSTGTVTCKYSTEDGTASKGRDYEEAEGVLTFNPGQLTTTIELHILPMGRYEQVVEFRVLLTDITGGGKFDPKRDGGPDSQILTVVIESDVAQKDHIDSLMQALQLSHNKAQITHANWRAQFRDALLVNGGEDSDEIGVMDKVMHVVTVFWKVVFAAIPPADYGGGWVCFLSSLMAIGVVTALIGDLASLLGCVVGMKDSTTAITLVALGTSLPDTFASKAAAEQDPFADASVGNVTGSNSVNVFLGLGLPWLIGALYWNSVGRTEEWQEYYRSKPQVAAYFNDWNQVGSEGKFVVIGDDLQFNVTVFSCTAVTCILVLCLRRRFFGGELGGPSVAKYMTAAFLVLLWFVYVISAIANTAATSVDTGCA